MQVGDTAGGMREEKHSAGSVFVYMQENKWSAVLPKSGLLQKSGMLEIGDVKGRLIWYNRG